MTTPLKIKDLPSEARPREAYMRSAAPGREIPDASLLAILIRTGRKGSSAAIEVRSSSFLCLKYKSAMAQRIANAERRWAGAS